MCTNITAACGVRVFIKYGTRFKRFYGRRVPYEYELKNHKGSIKVAKIVLLLQKQNL